MTGSVSRVAVIGALVALVFFALAGVVIVQPGAESFQRLGLLFGIIGTGVAALVGLLKADQAATQTNGKLDARIQAAVHRANNARRRGEAPLTDDEISAIATPATPYDLG